jgi:hypothetical protein
MQSSLMTSQEREVSQSYTSMNDTIWTGILCIYLEFLKMKTSAEVFSKWFLMKYKLYFRIYFLRTWPLKRLLESTFCEVTKPAVPDLEISKSCSQTLIAITSKLWSVIGLLVFYLNSETFIRRGIHAQCQICFSK